MKNELKEIFILNQDQLYDYVLRFVHAQAQNCFDIVGLESRKYLALIPKEVPLFPVLASHLDIKYKTPPDDLRTRNGYLTGLRSGERCILGGDDRNGVWTMLQLIRAGRGDLGYFFSTDEEDGRLGAKALANSDLLSDIESRISYFIQIDRRGTSDLAYYYCDGVSTINNNNFEAILKGFRYNGEEFHTQQGSSTDIVEYCHTTGLCGVNLSAGYFKEHGPEEKVNLGYLKSLPDIVTSLLAKLGTKIYAIESD